MTAWTELLENSGIGNDGARELYRTVRSVVFAHNFPPPPGYGRWTVDAVIEATHEFLTSPNAGERLAYLALTADSEASFQRLLDTAVANYFRSEGRRTAVGKIVIRLRELLDSEHGFAIVPAGTPGAGNVTLGDAEPDRVWDGDGSGLLAAAYAVDDVTVVRWRADSRREPPLSDAGSLRAVSAAVLAAARGSMRFGDLAAVVGRRFGLGPTALVTPTDELDLVADSGTGDIAAAGSDDIASAAAELLAGLPPRERLVLAWLGEPLRVIADRTGLARSTAGWVATRLRADLADTLRGEPDSAAIVVEAQRLARAATSGIVPPADT